MNIPFPILPQLAAQPARQQQSLAQALAAGAAQAAAATPPPIAAPQGLGGYAGALSAMLPDLKPGENASLSEAATDTSQMLNQDMYEQHLANNALLAGANRQYLQDTRTANQQVTEQNARIDLYNDWVSGKGRSPNAGGGALLSSIQQAGWRGGQVPGGSLGFYNNYALPLQPIRTDPQQLAKLQNVEPKYPYYQATASGARSRPPSSGGAGARREKYGRLRTPVWERQRYVWADSEDMPIGAAVQSMAEAGNGNPTDFFRSGIKEVVKGRALRDFKNDQGWVNPGKPQKGYTFDDAFREFLFNELHGNEDDPDVAGVRKYFANLAPHFSELTEPGDIDLKVDLPELIFNPNSKDPDGNPSTYFNPQAWTTLYTGVLSIMQQFLSNNPAKARQWVTRRNAGNEAIQYEEHGLPTFAEHLAAYYVGQFVGQGENLLKRNKAARKK